MFLFCRLDFCNSVIGTLNKCYKFFLSIFPLFLDIQILMGSLLFLRHGIQNSSYSHLLSSIYWDEICDVFTRDACTLMGMSMESPLSVR